MIKSDQMEVDNITEASDENESECSQMIYECQEADGEYIQIDESDDESQQEKTAEEEEDCTLFVRNLSFVTTEESLYESFAKFGELHYAKITVDKSTQQSRGTGFVKYKSKSNADECLAMFAEASVTATSNNPFMIDQRIVSVDVAVSRDIASKLTQASKVNAKVMDKRNIYLLREGVLFPESDDGKLQPELAAKSLEVFH
jgi:nucleolar protein 4